MDRYADKLYRYVRLRLAPRTELVEDVVQDIFVAALRGLDRFQGQSTVQSWLIGIARHKVEDYYRARLRAPSNLSDLGDAAIATTASSPRIDERIDHERQRDKTHRILAQLPEPYGLVLLWRYWEKRSTKEMAARTGRTDKAIERLLARARAVQDVVGGRLGGRSGVRSLLRRARSQKRRAGIRHRAGARAAQVSDLFGASGPAGRDRAIAQPEGDQGDGGRPLCVFEAVLSGAPAGQRVDSMNPCRVCHARILAEHLESAPIFWPHCPYASFHRR